MSHQRKLHAHEASRRGKPDQIETDIAQRIGALLLKKDRDARFDLRVAGSWDHGPQLDLGGEISRHLLTDDLHREIAHLVAENLGEVEREFGRVALFQRYNPQAHSLAANGHAGDSGIPIAVAYGNAPFFLPIERLVAVDLRNLFDNDIGYERERRSGTLAFAKYFDIPSEFSEYRRQFSGLLSDGKVDVRATYAGPELIGIHKIVVALQHAPGLPLRALREEGARWVTAYLEILSDLAGRDVGTPEIIVNGAGDWHVGGWRTPDAGNREAKPYSNVFGSYGCLEDAIGGEDPSKPSGTGAFAARWIAVQAVAAGIAPYVEVRLEYDIGSSSVGVNITSHGDREEQKKLERFVESLRIDLRIPALIERFNLRDPDLYEVTANGADFFHNPNLPWNKVDRRFGTGYKPPEEQTIGSSRRSFGGVG